MTSKSKTGLTLALLLGMALPAAAQQQNQEAYRPAGVTQVQQTPAQPQQQAPASPAQPGSPQPGMGMMGPGMMSPGMMGGAGMRPMMRSIVGLERIEGRLAFLRTEVKITDAQQKVWDDFVAAMRGATKRLQDARASMMSGAPGAGGQTGPAGSMGMMDMMGMMGMMGDANVDPVTHIEQHERFHAIRLDVLRTVKGPLTALYNALSDEQKKTFAELHPLYMIM